MKLLMISGGLIGFLIGIFFGMAQANEWPAILWRASVAAFLAGVVLRWWGRIWIKSLRESRGVRGIPDAKAEPLPTGPAKA
jgi:hypothetical protein